MVLKCNKTPRLFILFLTLFLIISVCSNKAEASIYSKLSDQEGTNPFIIAKSTLNKTEPTSDTSILNSSTVSQDVYESNIENYTNGSRSALPRLKEKMKMNKMSNIKVVKELLEERSRNSKSLILSNGFKIHAKSGTSMFYYDGGQWRDIDNNLRVDRNDKNFTHSMLTNNFKVKFNNNDENPTVMFSVYDQSVSYRPAEMNSVIGAVYDNKISYQNAWQSTNLEYSIHNDFLKMEMHLLDRNAPKLFKFEFNENKVDHRLNNDGSIDFIDANGEKVFRIPQMYVKDASSDSLRYDRLAVDIKRESDKTMLEIALDDNGLEYPIIIDPTTTYGSATPENPKTDYHIEMYTDRNGGEVIDLGWWYWYTSTEINIELPTDLEHRPYDVEFSITNSYSHGPETVEAGNSSTYVEANGKGNYIAYTNMRGKSNAQAIIQYRDEIGPSSIIFNLTKVPTKFAYDIYFVDEFGSDIKYYFGNPIPASYSISVPSTISTNWWVEYSDDSIAKWVETGSLKSGDPLVSGHNRYTFQLVAKDGSKYDYMLDIYREPTSDNVPPSLTLKLSTALYAKGLDVQVDAFDNIGVSKIKWAPGNQPKSYFTTAGKEIIKNSSGYRFYVQENGIYTVWATDGAGNQTVQTITINNIDNIKPSVPQNLKINKVGSEYLLTWDPSTDNAKMKYYNVYVGTDYTGRTNLTSYSFTIQNNRFYSIRVSAVDEADNESDLSMALIFANNLKYRYDRNGRLDYIELPSNKIIDYQYDINGNLLRIVLPN